MAFLDWINRNRQQAVAEKAQQPKAENAKQWHAPEATLEKGAQEPNNTPPPAVETRLDVIRAKLGRATQHHDPNGDGPPNRPAGGAADREAMRQNLTGLDRTAPAAQANEANAEQRLARALRYVDASTRPKVPKAPDVRWPRPPASWER
jgi:hypothetical protein